jgi:hypothetical protein
MPPPPLRSPLASAGARPAGLDPEDADEEEEPLAHGERARLQLRSFINKAQSLHDDLHRTNADSRVWAPLLAHFRQVEQVIETAARRRRRNSATWSSSSQADTSDGHILGADVSRWL